MTTWISSASIPCKEVHATHVEAHNIITGNPSFNARIAVEYDDLEDAVSALLGEPEFWPKPTSILQDVRCVSVGMENDNARYRTDSNGEIIDYDYFALLNLTYMPRAGRYLVDSNGQDVFWNDEAQPRIESRPMNHTLLIWGDESNPATIPSPTLPLSADEAPPHYSNGTNLVHTIEGFDIDFSDLKSLIGTVHNDTYISPITGEAFVADTLLLDGYEVINHFNFKSYRTGALSTTIRLIYKWKDIGWGRFWRNGLTGIPEGYYYIRKNQQPWSRVVPFPLADHDKYLGWVP